MFWIEYFFFFVAFLRKKRLPFLFLIKFSSFCVFETQKKRIPFIYPPFLGFMEILIMSKLFFQTPLVPPARSGIWEVRACHLYPSWPRGKWGRMFVRILQRRYRLLRKISKYFFPIILNFFFRNISMCIQSKLMDIFMGSNRAWRVILRKFGLWIP